MGEMAGKLDINMERIYKAGKMILEDYLTDRWP